MPSLTFFTGFSPFLLLLLLSLLLDASTTPSHCFGLSNAVSSAPRLLLSQKSKKCSSHVTKDSNQTICAPPPPPKKIKPKKKHSPPKPHAPPKPHSPPKPHAPGPKKPPVKPPSPPPVVPSGAAELSNDYYATTCPNLEGIIFNKVAQWVKTDRSLAASLLRLHFHDCMATGNDASILLKDPIRQSTEMYSNFSKGLRGFEIVDDIKLAVEKACPGIVSCADVLTVIARDATLQLGGPFWFVPFGRKDSLTSRIEDAAQVPHQESDANTLLQQFEAVGLSFADLAVLSGAHSIGQSHCFSFTGEGAAGANPSMNTTYAKILQNKCKPGPYAEVYNDPDTPFTLDLQYYTNLKRGMGLFKSDNSIYVDNPLTSSMVDAFLTQPGMWEAQFAVSMVNLGNVNVRTGRSQGEIRRVCSVQNTATSSQQH